jgi:predicted DCC family thiol-disulfide oxidoreductase YuxK
MSRILTFFDDCEAFFFRRISASGFGLLRIGWAVTALVYLLCQWNDITFFYSAKGIIPPELFPSSFRNDYRFTILTYITDPSAVFSVYLLLLAVLATAALGYRSRLSVIIATLLLFSFHERNLLPLGGGETVLRHLGFFLMIAPEIRAFSLDRAKLQWRHWSETRELLPPLTMAIWPWRLLLWQMIVIYVTSGLDKLSGSMWLDGTAVASALHHPHFARWPMPLMDIASVASPFLSYGAIVFEIGWLLMLIPQAITAKLPQIIRPHAIRRSLLLGGILFHGGIFVLMDVGSFSVAMLAGYLGLLLHEDFRDLRHWLNHNSQISTSQIIVLFDVACRLCRRSIFVLLLLDNLHRLRAVNFRDVQLRKQHASDIALKDLDRSMHIRMPAQGKFSTASGQRTTFRGFDAFRALTMHLPALWPITPLLYLPGIPLLGRRLYAHIAANRNRCADGYCIHESKNS